MSKFLTLITLSTVLGSLGCGSTTSDLKSDQVKEVVSSNKMDLQECYEKTSERKKARGKKPLELDVKLMVGASGDVVRVSIRGAARYPNLKKCLKTAMGKWKFPESRSRAPVFFPIAFNPR